MATKVERLPRTVPFGRLDELRSRPDAELIAYALACPHRWDSDYRLRRFNSRAALECFCKDGSRMRALVLRPVARGMVTNRNTERAE